MSEVAEEDDFEQEDPLAEPELIEASHLMKAWCVGCGGETLAVPEWVTRARCGPCLSAEVRAGAGVNGVGTPQPVVARWESEADTSGGAEFWHKDLKTSKWFRVLPPTEKHPEPEVRGVWGTEMPELAPEPVLKLAELAREGSWEVRAVYAKGNGMHGSTGRPTALRHVIALSFSGHPVAGVQAAATYVKPAKGGAWSWESVWVWGSALPHFGLCSLAELKGLLSSGELDTGAVRERVRVEEEAKAEQAAARKELKNLKLQGMSVERICSELGLELEREEVAKILTPARAKKESGS